MKKENNKLVWVDVYVAPVPDWDVVYPIFPRQRELELQGISSDRLRREKYHAWRLLEYALEKSLNLSLESAAPYRHWSGKWISEFCEFSIAHSGGVVAVAVSHYPVGVDVERRDRDLGPGFARRMFTDSENELLVASSERLTPIDIWCKKEAIFKKKGENSFIPRLTETAGESICSFCVAFSGVEYTLAVATEDGARVEILIPDDFS